MAGRPEEFTDLQRRVCDEYLVDFNGTQAYRRAGGTGKDASRNAVHILNKPHCQAYLAQRMRRISDKLEVQAEDVIRELMKVGFFDVGDLFDDAGRLLHPKQMSETARKAVSGVKVTRKVEDGEVIDVLDVRLWNKVESLHMIGKWLKMWVELREVKVEVDIAQKLREATNRERKLKAIDGGKGRRARAS